jgi:hypothetical protein
MNTRWVLPAAFSLIFVAAAAAQHEHRTGQQQAHHGMPHKVAEAAGLYSHIDAAGRTITVRVGPVSLPANSDHNAVAQAPDMHLEIPFDGWLIAYHPRLTDASGKTLPSRLLHHAAFWNVSRSDFLCPNKEEHIFGAGGEMSDWSALPGFGYPVSKGTRIRVNTMFHNPTQTDYPDVHIEVVMEYRLADGGVQLKSAYPAWFDVMECGDSGYDLKPGLNTATGRFMLKHAGTLLGVGGHLHDYGLGLDLVNATRNETVATLAPQLDSEGRIRSMPIVTFLDRGGYRLIRGETIRVTATYDNPTGKPLPDGAMGIVVGYFLPDNDAEMSVYQRK